MERLNHVQNVVFLEMWIVPAIIGVASLVAGMIGQRKQAKENRRLQESQQAANDAYLEKQLQYNTPANQMLRYQEAGLNPNLVYGQGNPGNQSAPLTAPETRPTDYQSLGANLGPIVNQSLMTQAQVQAINAKTRQTYVLTQLNELQARVLAANPLLNEEGFKAILDSLKSAAEIKAADAGIKGLTAEWFKGEKSFNVDGTPLHGPAGALKLEAELKLLEQRFRLGELDSKLKAEVLQSKEFQNAILEVQKKWMTDADVTPQHIYQFIQLLLMKIL